MTQEELDALMAGGFDDEILEESPEKESKSSQNNSSYSNENFNDNQEMANYRVDAAKSWPPPPPTDDHKVVHQLDDVTRDSEVKATQVFDKLESISNMLYDIDSNASSLNKCLDENIALFELLQQKFPKINKFSEMIQKNDEAKMFLENITSNSQMGNDDVMMAMDIMQFQDIHRQKIERVVNVMRALVKYMNHLFEGKIEDEKRVSSAVHIKGDTTTEDVVTNDDIEALIASFGKKD